MFKKDTILVGHASKKSLPLKTLFLNPMAGILFSNQKKKSDVVSYGKRLIKVASVANAVLFYLVLFCGVLTIW